MGFFSECMNNLLTTHMSVGSTHMRANSTRMLVKLTNMRVDLTSMCAYQRILGVSTKSKYVLIQCYFSINRINALKVMI
jgi:hypothetical protein